MKNLKPRQVNHYYPFGGLMGDNVNGDAQRYKYNGKELDRMNGLDWMDYGARMYDGGRFTTVDPLAEKKPWQSPYVYGRNNPLRFVDPDGNDDWDKVVGFAYGIVTNVIPGTGNLRDSYTPNNSVDYNAGLKSADQVSTAIGTALVLDGGRNVATGLGVASASAAVTVASGGTAAPVTAVSGTGGVALIGTGTLEAGAGAVMLANTSSNSSKGYNRGKNTDSSKNERHGDGGRAIGKSQKQLSNLQKQYENATTKKEKQRIANKIKHVTENAYKKRHGEEHSNANKR